jgi:phosphoribosylformylglycinamidine synthase
VSHLRIPGFEQPWEKTLGKPDRIVSAMDIMIDGPIGGRRSTTSSAGRTSAATFRTFEQAAAGDAENRTRGTTSPS